MLYTKSFEKLLQARRTELLARIWEIEASLANPPEPGVEDRAAESDELEILEKVAMSGNHELHSVDAALRRLAEGTFGICVECGASIDPKRLKALPDTAFCRSCAK